MLYDSTTQSTVSLCLHKSLCDVWQQYRVDCVVGNVYKQVMPEICCHSNCITCIYVVIPVLSPCFLYHHSPLSSLSAHFSPGFPTIILHQCTKFGDNRTQRLKINMGINNIYRFLLPEDVCCLKIVVSVLMKTCHSTSVYIPHLVVRGPSI